MPITSDDKAELQRLLGDWVPGTERLATFLAEHSNLPGPRGNLELADALAAAVEAMARGDAGRMWLLAVDMASETAAAAPVNDPREFVAFCGVRALASVAAVDASRLREALVRLRAAANDERWRLREAVAMALQRLLAVHDEAALAALGEWVQTGNCLEWRAVAAALADPPLLKRRDLAERALALHRDILARVAVVADRRAADFRALRQGLGYSLSVVVAAVPDAGFALLRQLAASSDGDVKWIVAENLKKSRLAKPYAAEVSAIRGVLTDRADCAD